MCARHRMAYLRGSAFLSAGAGQQLYQCSLCLSCSQLRRLLPFILSGRRAPAGLTSAGGLVPGLLPARWQAVCCDCGERALQPRLTHRGDCCLPACLRSEMNIGLVLKERKKNSIYRQATSRIKGACLEFTKWSVCIYFLFNIHLFLFYVYEYFACMKYKYTMHFPAACGGHKIT